MGTPYTPDFNKAILFFEEIGVSPAILHQELTCLKLAGVLEEVSALVIGHLSDCKDKKYPRDNRLISEIVMEVVNNLQIPIINVDYFGHNSADFLTFPIGGEAKLDTAKKQFLLQVEKSKDRKKIRI